MYRTLVIALLSNVIVVSTAWAVDGDAFDLDFTDLLRESMVEEQPVKPDPLAQTLNGIFELNGPAAAIIVDDRDERESGTSNNPVVVLELTPTVDSEAKANAESDSQQDTFHQSKSIDRDVRDEVNVVANDDSNADVNDAPTNDTPNVELQRASDESASSVVPRNTDEEPWQQFRTKGVNTSVTIAIPALDNALTPRNDILLSSMIMENMELAALLPFESQRVGGIGANWSPRRVRVVYPDFVINRPTLPTVDVGGIRQAVAPIAAFVAAFTSPRATSQISLADELSVEPFEDISITENPNTLCRLTRQTPRVMSVNVPSSCRRGPISTEENALVTSTCPDDANIASANPVSSEKNSGSTFWMVLSWLSILVFVPIAYWLRKLRRVQNIEDRIRARIPRQPMRFPSPSPAVGDILNRETSNPVNAEIIPESDPDLFSPNQVSSETIQDSLEAEIDRMAAMLNDESNSPHADWLSIGKSLVMEELNAIEAANSENVDESTQYPPDSPTVDVEANPEITLGKEYSVRELDDDLTFLEKVKAVSHPEPDPDLTTEESSSEIQDEFSELLNSRSIIVSKQDDLTRIHGIGPAIQKVLNQAHMLKYSDLADIDPDLLVDILQAAGRPFDTVNPTTWPLQAVLAMQGEWNRVALYKAQVTAWDVEGAIIEPFVDDTPQPGVTETVEADQIAKFFSINK